MTTGDKMRLNALNDLRRHPTIFLCMGILIYTIVFSCIGILLHYSFKSSAWDLGIYEQMIWSTTNTGRLFWYTAEVLVNPSCNFFGIHFSPILFLVVPIYAIHQSTETLLVLQGSVLALAAIPLYKLVLLESKSVKQASIFSLIYFAYPPINSLMMFDFHVQAFLPLLFFSAFYYFRKEDWTKYFLFIVLALMVVEIIPLIVVFFGFYGLWVNRKKLSHLIRSSNLGGFLAEKSVVCSIATIALGGAWFVLARAVIFSVNPTVRPNPNWADFGDPIHGLPGLVFNLLANPLKTVTAIVTPVLPKAVYLFVLFAPLAFLSFLSPPSLMIGAPWFVIAFLSSYPSYYNPIAHQYVAFVVPFIFISAIYGVKRLIALKDHYVSNKRFADFSNAITKTRYRKAMVVICLFLAIALPYDAILNPNGRLSHPPVISEHDKVLEIFIGLIPSNASVLTQNDLFPHISRRLYVYAPMPNARGDLPTNVAFEYVFVDTTSVWYTDSLRSYIYNVTKDGSFGTEYASNGVLLLKQGYVGETIDPMLNSVRVEASQKSSGATAINIHVAEFEIWHDSLRTIPEMERKS
jgi:uncharacterized membrane protein